MFNEEQIALLEADLDSSAVRDRTQAGRDVFYVEGWHVIAEANRIFGFDAWDRYSELTRLGEPEHVDSKWRVRYMAKVRISVTAPDGQNVTRDGCGYGSGIAKDLGDAYEGAIKEAETDAMKRALVTFGNPFGLALYDKEQRHVAREPDPRVIAAEIRDKINAAQTLEAVNAFMKAERVSKLPAKTQEWLRAKAANRLALLAAAPPKTGEAA